MFTILEKTLLLKTVDLFQEIPGELLSQVSKISKARPYEKDSAIFKEGDAGDSMFIVFEGIVSIKKGSKEIAELKKADLNTRDIEKAVLIIKGTAKNMGITVE